MKRILILILSMLFLVSTVGLSQTTVSNVYITGNFTVGSTLTGYYTTSGGTGNDIVLSWYTISPRTDLGITANSYTLESADQGKNIYFKVAIYQNGTGTLITADSSALSPVISGNSSPVAKDVRILGVQHSGMTVYGAYNYSDLENNPEGTSQFKWEVADDQAGSNPQTVSTGSYSYTILDADTGKHLRFSVTPVASAGTTPGAEASSVWSSSAIINDAPVSSIPAILVTSKNVNSVLTGHYSFSDTEGDIESGSKYQWYSSSSLSGTYNPILNDTLISHVILMTEQGRYFKFSVTPKSSSGKSPGILKQSNSCGPANTMPSASTLTISGSTTNGSTLRARFNYSDVDGDPKGNCLFQWYRGTTAVTGATDSLYLLGPDDVGLRMKFDVTPVSSTGYPDTGDKKTSALSNTVTDPAAVAPGAKDVCLAGYRSAQSVLTGKYTYVKNGYNEANSEVLWLSGNNVIKSSVSDPDKDDTLKLREIYIDTKIRFAVIPRNKNGVRGDTVFSLPLAIFTMPRLSFTIADPDITLTASPAGGFFTGTEVSNNIFSPKNVNFNDSPFSVTYQLTIDTGSHTCVQKAYTKLSVSGINMAFESFEDRYCQNHGQDIIYVRKMPKGYTGTFIINDVIDSYQKVNDTTIIIDPSKMTSGYKELKFSADSAGDKHLEIPPRPFMVDAVPVVTITNLPNDTVLCNNIVPFKLYASHGPGTFTGPVKGVFIDLSDKVGNAVVNYTHTTDNGCVTSVSVPIKINPSPEVHFAAKDYCIEDDNDTTKFINKTLPVINPLTPADSVNKWSWSFYDAGGSDTSTLKNPGYLYKTGGIKRVVLTATTLNGCVSVKDSTIDLGVKPVADFYWTKECYLKEKIDSIILKDTTFSASTIASRTWIFNHSVTRNRIVADRSQGYLKEDSGYINVQYIVRTNYAGCHDTVDKDVYIRPTVQLKTDDYFEDFEDGKNGWVKDYEDHNTWSFGKPSRTVIQNAVPPGVNAWVTNFKTDTIEHSSIISPCFDFRDIQRPMIKIKLWRRFDINRDGAALQYKIGDDPLGWQYVGTLDDGINWYNSTLIKGRPGGDQVGWTAGTNNQRDPDWVEARHELDELTGKEDVKFRIVYGSDGTARANDGIAFDEIWIGRRTRSVLLEHFTNNMSADASAATSMVNEQVKDDSIDVINIQYHTNFPGSDDPYYKDNPGDASARILYYGLSRTPYSFIDGGTGKNYANSFDYRPTPLDSPLDNNDLKRRGLINPYFLITLSTDITSDGVLTVSGQIKAVEAITNLENVTLYLAVTERKSNGKPAIGGDTVFYNVLRKFIPDAGGIPLNKSWVKDDVYNIAERSWKIEKIPNGSDIEVIAFVQNNIRKEIYQAVSNREHNVPVGIDNLFMNNGKGFSIYPNPASENLTIGFEQSLVGETEILIYDFRGTVVRSYKAGPGQSEYTITALGLKGGIYLVKINSGGTDRGFKKLVVSDY